MLSVLELLRRSMSSEPARRSERLRGSRNADDEEQLSEADPDYVAEEDLNSEAESEEEEMELAWTGVPDEEDVEDEDAEDYIDRSGNFPPLPEHPAPMQHSLSYMVDLHTSALNGHTHPHQVTSHKARPSALSMMKAREGTAKGSAGHGWSHAQCCHMTAFHAVPNQPHRIIDSLPSRAYITQFSPMGDRLVAAFQRDRRIRVYDVDHDWQMIKDVNCRNLRWTVTDTCLSPNQTFLLYASITPIVHMVSMRHGNVQSTANVTDIHEALHFDQLHGRSENHQRYSSFGIWSLRWSNDGREIIAGTGDSCVYVFDVELAKTTQRVPAHTEDVNAVTYLDDSCQMLASGSDDRLVKIWDRRCVGQGRSRPAGVMLGHTEGITHLDPRGDGRYLISNSKDQTIKLWDLRKMMTHSAADRAINKARCSYQWDYRWMEYPGRGRDVRHPADNSVMTYRGHQVLRTLMRAYFSPAHTTGQRYIYTGSYDGSIVIIDVVTGRVEHRLRYHKEIVRDCSWHPHQSMLVSGCFDGSLCQWEPASPDIDRQALPTPSYDRLEDEY